MSEQTESPNVSVETNGRVLSGGPGTSVEGLEQAIERHEPEPTSPSEPQADKPTRGQKRFSELTREREEARQRATEANERAIALESRLKAIEERTAQAGNPDKPRDGAASRDAVAPNPRQEAAPSATRPKPSEDEVGTKYAKYGDYVEDLADWRYEQREAAAEQRRASEARNEKWTQTQASARTLYPDFDQVLASGPGANVDIDKDRIMRMLDTPGGEHIIYKLAKDADAAQRVAKMSDFDFGILFKSLLPAENGAPSASPVRPRASTAPTPYVPVNGGGRTTATSSADAAAKGNFDEYRLKRAAERGVKPKYR